MKAPTPDQFKNLHKKTFIWIIGTGLIGFMIMAFLFNMDSTSRASTKQPQHYSPGEVTYLNQETDSTNYPVYGILKSNTALKNDSTFIPPTPEELFGKEVLDDLKSEENYQEKPKKVVIKRVPARGGHQVTNNDDENNKLHQQALHSSIGFNAGNKTNKAHTTSNGNSNPQKYLNQAQRLKESMATNTNQKISREFNHSDGNSISSRFKVPKTPYTLLEGTLIPASLVTGINSDLPGDIIAIVNRDVYDSVHQKYLLIPKGSKLIGSYDERVVLNQHKLLMSWDRIIFPDGRSLNLPDLNTYDLQGRSGLAGDVDNHFWRIFGQSAMLSLIGAGTAVATNSGQSYGRWGRQSAGEIVGRRIAMEFNRVANKVLEKNLRISPTITIETGTKFNVFLAGDISFKQPYEYNPVGQ